MKVKTPEMIEAMRARMKKARESKKAKAPENVPPLSVPVDEKEFVYPDGDYYCMNRKEGYYQIVTLHIKAGEVTGGEISQINVFGVQMGKMIRAIQRGRK